MKRALAVLAFSLWTVPALAQDVPRDQRARAQQLFDLALADAEKGDFAAACPKFLASQDADPKTSTLMNLANCYQHNGQTASAWGAFREAEVLAHKAARPELEASARSRAAALEPKLLRLNIVVPQSSRLDGLVVTRDGVRLTPGEWGVAIPVDPGEHVLTASAAGRQSWAEHVEIDKESKTVELPILEAVPIEPTPPPTFDPHPPGPPPPKGLSTLQIAGLAGGGVGVAALVAGGVLALVAKGNYDDARDRCAGSTTTCPAGAVSDADSAYRQANVATAFVITGAVLAAAGAAVVIIAPDKKQKLAVSPAGLRATF